MSDISGNQIDKTTDAVATEIEVTTENWPDLRAAGYRHFLNLVPEKQTETEFLEVTELARRAGPLAFGAFYDEDLQRPIDDHCDLGLYVLRPKGWMPF